MYTDIYTVYLTSSSRFLRAGGVQTSRGVQRVSADEGWFSELDRSNGWTHTTWIFIWIHQFYTQHVYLYTYIIYIFTYRSCMYIYIIMIMIMINYANCSYYFLYFFGGDEPNLC